MPFGMDLDGFFRSPDIFTPAIMPVKAGKNNANNAPYPAFSYPLKLDAKDAGEKCKADPRYMVRIPRSNAINIPNWNFSAKSAPENVTSSNTIPVPRER